MDPTLDRLCFVIMLGGFLTEMGSVKCLQRWCWFDRREEMCSSNEFLFVMEQLLMCFLQAVFSYK